MAAHPLPPSSPSPGRGEPGVVARAIRTVERGPDPPGPSRFGPLATVVRRGLLRALRPYSAGEARIDHALAEAVADLDGRLQALERAFGGADSVGAGAVEAGSKATAADSECPTADDLQPPWLVQVRRDQESMRRLIHSLPPDANCIDVGAHGGAVLAEIVSAAPRGHHIAYEPIPHLAEALRARYPGVDVRCAAVSDREGTASFSYVRAAPEWSGLRFRPLPDGSEGDVEQIEVPLESLDGALPEGFVPALIKIDVEGAEEAVIRGAARTLRRYRPIVLFEHGAGSSDVYGTTPRSMHALLSDELDSRSPISTATARTAPRSSSACSTPTSASTSSPSRDPPADARQLRRGPPAA